ncbi:hypothetical protein AB0D04_12360 [Streptomyces sp. NPDC048483]|uniref:hypothetical protein n=1 Tax=Streptomyces sp. NPDC048483 TaxID=3154927 RepID=UPI003425914C
MRKLRKAAVAVAVLGSVGLLGAGAGTAYAGGGTADGNYSRTQYSQGDSYRPQSSGGHKHGKSHGHKVIIRQGTTCRSWEANADVLGEVGVANGLAGNAGGGAGKPGLQSTRIGSSAGCNNIVRL